MKVFATVFFVVILFVSLNLSAAELKLIKTIGDERDDYTFFILTGAVMSKDKEIYVLDGQGVYIARYNWSGEFLSRIGQSGQGPSDLYSPWCLNICNDKVYVLDYGNKRIAEADLQLKEFDYYKMNPKSYFSSSCYALPDGTFLGNFNLVEENRGRLGIVDKDGNVLSHFFNEYPIAIDVDMKKLSIDESFQMKTRRFVISKETESKIGLDEEKKKVLVSFSKPANPIRFFVYSLKGELLKTFSYPLDKKYQFFDFYVNFKSFADIRDKSRYPSRSYVPMIPSLFIHKDHYIASLRLQDFEKKKIVSETSYLLIFDKEGKLKDRIALDNDLGIFSISKDGYVFGSKGDEEVAKLYIYQLTL